MHISYIDKCSKEDILLNILFYELKKNLPLFRIKRFVYHFIIDLRFICSFIGDGQGKTYLHHIGTHHFAKLHISYCLFNKLLKNKRSMDLISRTCAVVQLWNMCSILKCLSEAMFKSQWTSNFFEFIFFSDIKIKIEAQRPTLLCT